MLLITSTALMGALANSVVHVIMYTYYGFTAFGPSVQKYIGKYKKRVTQLQLVSMYVYNGDYDVGKTACAILSVVRLMQCIIYDNQENVNDLADVLRSNKCLVWVVII